jgi:dienelactone hydrolase
MKKTISYLCLLLIPHMLLAQEIIDIPYTDAPESTRWTKPEENQLSEYAKINVLVNISKPQLVYYKPNPDKANGASVIVCPGGGFHCLNVAVEGYPVAERLADNGIAVFVLKYRLIPTSGDAIGEYFDKKKKGKHREKEGIDLAIADGISAIKYLRENASSLGINKNKIGVIGFSAGGTVAIGSVFQDIDTIRPDFVAPIYAYLLPFSNMEVPDNAPPMFVCVAGNDDPERVEQNIDIYRRWFRKVPETELHIYSTGGHAFGYSKNGDRINDWMNRFEDWMITIGWMASE